MDGNKIPNEYENIVDLNIMKFINSHIHIYKKLGFTPNKLTIMAMITAILTLYLIHKKEYKYAAIFFLISYYFDSADGKFARKYNMVTKFGDYFDHGVDTLKYILIIIFLYKDDPEKIKRIVPLVAFILLICGFHILVQETLFEKEKNKSIIGIIKLNKQFAENNLYLIKYFGCGTGHLLFALIIFFWEKI